MTSEVIGLRGVLSEDSAPSQGHTMLVKTPDDTAHPFDRATQVAVTDGRWHGKTSDDYFAFVGPFGGATAATMLRALMEQPERAGDPLSITVNFARPSPAVRSTSTSG